MLQYVAMSVVPTKTGAWCGFCPGHVLLATVIKGHTGAVYPGVSTVNASTVPGSGGFF